MCNQTTGSLRTIRGTASPISKAISKARVAPGPLRGSGSSFRRGYRYGASAVCFGTNAECNQHRKSKKSGALIGCETAPDGVKLDCIVTPNPHVDLKDLRTQCKSTP